MRPNWMAMTALALVASVAAPRPAAAQSDVGRTSIGLEAGLPLVFGVDFAHQFAPHWRAGIGFARVSGLTALRAEAHWLLFEPERNRFVPLVVAGSTQYFLNDGDRDATPLGVHAALGLDLFLEGPVSLGIRVGGLKTFGSSGADDAKVFSVRNGFSSGMFNLGARYHF